MSERRLFNELILETLFHISSTLLSFDNSSCLFVVDKIKGLSHASSLIEVTTHIVWGYNCLRSLFACLKIHIPMMCCRDMLIWWLMNTYYTRNKTFAVFLRTLDTLLWCNCRRTRFEREISRIFPQWMNAFVICCFYCWAHTC